jgi:hypothetical protein
MFDYGPDKLIGAMQLAGKLNLLTLKRVFAFG